MLTDDLYQVVTMDTGEGWIKSSIRFNREHAIFKGHFPGQPIVPGVCMIRIVRELMETCLKSSCRLVAAHSVKFMAFLDPSEATAVDVVIDFNLGENCYSVKAALSSAPVVYFKMTCQFEIS